MAESNLWIVVGLGNPGPEYSTHRHNVGQMVLSEIAARHAASFRVHKAAVKVAEGNSAAGAKKFVLAAPNSYMNLSGAPVARLLSYYSADPDRLIVVHDELDLPFDVLRVKQGGGHGGHNGLRDIISALGTSDFNRIRVGIGRPPGRQSAADFVLRAFSSAERSVLPSFLGDAADAVEKVIADGVLAAQQLFHAPQQNSTTP